MRENFRSHGFPAWRFAIWLLTGAALLGTVGCKPTEKNYSEAYDVARRKRDRDEERHRRLQEDLGVDREKLRSVDGPAHHTFQVPDSLGGGTLDIAVRRLALSRADSVAECSLSVAAFRMRSNADALAADLRSEGFPGARAVSGGDEEYVIIDENAEPAALARTLRRFSSRLKDFPYVGQGEPVLLMRF